MSVPSILSSNLFSYNAQSVQDRMQQLRKDSQQLGQALQTGNLSGAPADFCGYARKTARNRHPRKAATRSRRRFNS
jgi:hypothetical protein